MLLTVNAISNYLATEGAEKVSFLSKKKGIIIRGHFGRDKVYEITLSTPQMAKILITLQKEGLIEFDSLNLKFECSRLSAPEGCFFYFQGANECGIMVVSRQRLNNTLTSLLQFISSKTQPFDHWLKETASKC